MIWFCFVNQFLILIVFLIKHLSFALCYIRYILHYVMYYTMLYTVLYTCIIRLYCVVYIYILSSDNCILTGWSLEDLLWWACPGDSGWVCYEIWNRIYIPGNDVSSSPFNYWYMHALSFILIYFILIVKPTILLI